MLRLEDPLRVIALQVKQDLLVLQGLRDCRDAQDLPVQQVCQDVREIKVSRACQAALGLPDNQENLDLSARQGVQEIMVNRAQKEKMDNQAAQDQRDLQAAMEQKEKKVRTDYQANQASTDRQEHLDALGLLGHQENRALTANVNVSNVIVRQRAQITIGSKIKQ